MERFAAPNKLPDRGGQYENFRRVGNVEIWFSKHATGVARFHCATWDNIDVDVGVEFQEFDREYLDDLMSQIDVKINEYRIQRMLGGASSIQNKAAVKTRH
jgi:hypothetical protein